MRRPTLGRTVCACVLLIANPQKERPPSIKGLIPYWTAVHDETGRCRFSIPPTWQTDRAGGSEIARAPDGSVTLQQWWLAASDWPAYKAEARHLLQPIAVHEDSAQRLSFDYAAGWPGDHQFVAIPAATGVCAAEIDIRPGTRATLKATLEKIVQSIVAPD